uniref:helix-turn-helix domain-containing protein n=1 Tax=Castellaniella defragrans TaxID=75697 RepID=UPI00333E244D
MRPKQTDRTLAAFGQAVRAYRIAAGLTQEQLADAAGIHPGYLGTVERGEKNISLLNIVALGRALAVLPSELMEVVDVAVSKPAVVRKQRNPR